MEILVDKNTIFECEMLEGVEGFCASYAVGNFNTYARTIVDDYTYDGEVKCHSDILKCMLAYYACDGILLFGDCKNGHAWRYIFPYVPKRLFYVTTKGGYVYRCKAHITSSFRNGNTTNQVKMLYVIMQRWPRKEVSK